MYLSLFLILGGNVTPASNKGWEFSLALFFLDNVFVKTFFVIPYNSGQI